MDGQWTLADCVYCVKRMKGYSESTCCYKLSDYELIAQMLTYYFIQ